MSYVLPHKLAHQHMLNKLQKYAIFDLVAGHLSQHHVCDCFRNVLVFDDRPFRQ